MNPVKVVQLGWRDDPIGQVDFPGKPLVLRHGIGSGMARDPNEQGIVWAIADRGPNLKIETAVEHYGWCAPDGSDDLDGAKVIPRLDLGPYIAKLRITDDAVELCEIVRLTGRDGRPIPGCPVPGGDHMDCEPAFDFDGRSIDPDPAGMDTEGIAALRDGTFWIGEEYGPSLVLVDSGGKVLRRLVPEQCPIARESDEVEDILPRLAARRHLNRGFEAVTVTPSERRLFIAFQSPLANPDESAFKQARHVRIWELETGGGVVAQYLYPLDAPDSFERDAAKDTVRRRDLKVCELVAVGETTLLVLERASETCKIYRVELEPGRHLPDSHLEWDTRPTIEELSGADRPFELPVLDKELLFTSDDHPEVCADIEGMTTLSDRSLLLVSDNDFGVEDKATGFFRLEFERPLASV